MEYTIMLQGIVGSTAYGLAGPDSDVDRLGLFAAPTVALLGLHTPAESQVSYAPDVTRHEAGKYCRLALGGNPTVSELMWLPAELYEVRTAFGDELIGIRGSFLSAKRIRDSYLGYATQQFRKLESRGDGTFSSETARRTAKHARHLLRLCWQGLHLYRTGELLIRLDDPAAFRAFGDSVAGGDIELARRTLARYEADFADLRSPLPDRPDERAVEDWLLRVRRANYEPAGTVIG
ncbi:nucleotidyltransferase domain-containing protein [Dactylosporangium sp. CS-047395]|uniref:nucleotidyltransferase domain-containing protein n=1 Tax=Dactylosporangium sp. CS-047395 TaxID=3239936 RepID=UPI003D8FC281